jgi:hypothetical protein
MRDMKIIKMENIHENDVLIVESLEFQMVRNIKLK